MFFISWTKTRVYHDDKVDLAGMVGVEVLTGMMYILCPNYSKLNYIIIIKVIYSMYMLPTNLDKKKKKKAYTLVH